MKSFQIGRLYDALRRLFLKARKFIFAKYGKGRKRAGLHSILAVIVNILSHAGVTNKRRRSS